MFLTGFGFGLITGALLFALIILALGASIHTEDM
jgi:hypothetical protein